ncbi:QueT transporter family protein [Streptococcus cuniculipharyngis]|uniref:Queuosine transporter QueT n=1 Tax=Streptococcus cuniculipharyngis TaxID=1562651 RepID=A0A5C5SCM0_9STRE|nr:QueT transporter family protein [Streptococcus cuniculipharyngis]TWS98032.1 queuosine transporter QueT [Streptococcus cuniculipharyngis]
MKSLTSRDYVQVALVAAIYIVFTVLPPFNAISYGPYQFRLSEMLNFLAFYHPKYILAVTLGCMIANFYSFGLIDVVVGGLSTLIFVSLGVKLFKGYQKDYLFKGQLNKAFFYFSIFFALSMVTVAAELAIIAKAPFFWTWLTTGLGELLSLLVGSLVIEKLGQRIDFRR